MFTQHFQQIVTRIQLAWGFTRTRIWERYLLEGGGEIQHGVRGEGRLGAKLPVKTRPFPHEW